MERLILLFLASVFGICSCYNQQVDESIGRITLIQDSLVENPLETKPVLHEVCENTKLSIQFDIAVEFKCFSLPEGLYDSCIAVIIVKDKDSTRHFDSVIVASNFYYVPLISFNCDSMLSYATMYNADRLEMDNYLGDVIIADFNFDNKDDIAVINAMSNSGAFYSYFTQSPDKKFVFDSYLTDSISFFPQINKSRKELITNVRSGACCVNEHLYRYISPTKKWKKVSQNRHCGC